MLVRLDQVPEAIRPAVPNPGGGYANQHFFWQILGGRRQAGLA
jgi:hypothetical protein